jgi:hypothetical protein
LAVTKLAIAATANNIIKVPFFHLPSFSLIAIAMANKKPEIEPRELYDTVLVLDFG